MLAGNSRRSELVRRIHGCSKTDQEGCTNCYAAAFAPRNPSLLGVWGDDGVRVKSKSFIKNLHKWNKQGEAEGRSISVFPSLCDPFEDREELYSWRTEMFMAIDECPFVNLLLLTKRPENIQSMWNDIDTRPAGCQQKHRKNVWLITSVSDQETADRNIPLLIKCRNLSPVLGVSYEPALGPVDFRKWLYSSCICVDEGFPDRETGVVECGRCDSTGISENPSFDLDWLICGGESGPGARPFYLEDARMAMLDCREAGVPFFMKQFGANPQTRFESTFMPECVKDKKGGNLDEWTPDLRVREFPRV